MKVRLTFFALLSFFILVSISIIQAQVDTLWTKTFGGSEGDCGSSVQQTTDNGYIIVGNTDLTGLGFYAILLIKTDVSGEMLWTKTFGAVGYADVCSVQQTTDGGYIIVGGTLSSGAFGINLWLIKTDATGDTLWTKIYGGDYTDYGRSVQQTSDEGYIIAGYTDSFGSGEYDVWLIKTDVSGDTLWTKTFGGSEFEEGYSIQQTTDGGYIIVGRVYGIHYTDVWLIKTNSAGDTLWTKTFRGSGSEGGLSVQQTTDEGFIITGYAYSSNANYPDVLLIKTDATGDTLWIKTYGGSSIDEGSSVQQTTDGGYIITGYTFSFGAGGSDVWLIKTDASGDTLWTKTYGGSGYDGGNSIQLTTDGGYIITGGKDGDVWLIKTTPDINKIEQNEDIIILDFSLQQNHPNPFNPTTQITYTLPHSNNVSLKIYDLLGKEVQTLVNEYQTVGSYSLNFDASRLSSGIYFYQLKVGNNFVATKKMILTR